MDFSAIQSDLTRLSILRIDSTEALVLAIGQQMSARVIKIETDGQLLLSMGGQRFQARTNLPLTEGDELTVKVTQTGPTIELRLVNEKAEPAVKNFLLATVMKALDQSSVGEQISDPAKLLQGIQQLIEQDAKGLNASQVKQLEQLLRPVAMSANVHELQVALRNLLENSGLFFEGKLRTLLENLQETPEAALKKLSSDLKVLLSQIEKALAKPDAPTLPALPKAAGQSNLEEAALALANRVVGGKGSVEENVLQQKGALTEQILSRQTEAAYQWMKDGSFQAQVPLQFYSQPVNARIRFFPESGKTLSSRPGGSFTIDVSLELPQIGKMEAWAQWVNEQISVKLYVENEAAHELFQGQLDELSNGLTNAGFHNITLEVKTDPVRLYREGCHQEETPVLEGSLLSIRI